MRILHIIDSGGLYGAESVLLHLVREQQRQGLSPVIGSIGVPGEGEKPLEREARRRGAAVECFRMRAGPDAAGIRRILRYARGGGFDLLHSHGYKGNILLGLLPRSWRGLPMLTTVHGFTWTGGASRMLLYQVLDALSLLAIDRVVLVSPQMRDHPWLRRLGSHRFAVVANGIPVGEDTLRGPLPDAVAGFVADGCRIAFAGRLSAEKGPDLLLEAAAPLLAADPDRRLVYFGEGPMRGELQARAQALGVASSICFAGYQPDVGSVLHHFDLFVMPSLTEGLPMVLLEAMLSGVPVVATQVGGVPAILDAGRCGLLVPPREVGALREAMAAVIEGETAARARAVLAQARVRTSCSSAVMAEGYRQIYEELVRR